jgi:uncharacterized protein
MANLLLEVRDVGTHTLDLGAVHAGIIAENQALGAGAPASRSSDGVLRFRGTMDVTLVLTHRCNLACTYCYAGDHHAAQMDDATMDRALELLYTDGADRAQLSFFGGEPFLAFTAMRRAVAGARERAAGRPLLLQCTTNGAALTDEHVRFIVQTGLRVTVSIDGVKAAHDLNRVRAGGQSSFAAVERGLRMLVEAGVRPEAMMVITPDTARWVQESVSWLWDAGVERVRANLSLRADWDEHRDVLQRQLVAVGRDLLGRRLELRRRVREIPAALVETLQVVEFEPFTPRGGGCAAAPARNQVVVGTSGNLYPCAPMVGEDRDDGAEAALRIGHVTDGAAAIAPRTGDGCASGGTCSCAAYLETGDPTTGGENGLWFARVCREIGAAVVAGLAADAPHPIIVAAPPPRRRTSRRALLGAFIGVGGLALAGGGQLVTLRLARDGKAACPRTAGEITAPPPPPVVVAPTPPLDARVDGGLSAPPPPPPGGLAPPPVKPRR